MYRRVSQLIVKEQVMERNWTFMKWRNKTCSKLSLHIVSFECWIQLGVWEGTHLSKARPPITALSARSVSKEPFTPFVSIDKVLSGYQRR